MISMTFTRRYGGNRNWTDRDYILNGSFFVQYAIKYGTPGQIIKKSDKEVPNLPPKKMGTSKIAPEPEAMDTTCSSSPEQEKKKL